MSNIENLHWLYKQLNAEAEEQGIGQGSEGARYCLAAADEIESLRQQLAAANVLIAEQNKLAKERQEWALHTNEVIRSLNQQLADALLERDAIKREWDKAYDIAMLTKQQLAEAQQTIERQAAQIEMLRDFIETAPVSTGVCCCGESMEGHSSPMNCGHTPVDLWDHSVVSVLSDTPDQALEQFAVRVREQCAKVCENEYSYTVFHTDQRAAINCAAAIRAINGVCDV